MSFDVKIVINATVTNNAINSLVWFEPVRFKTAFASHLKKPVSSKKIESTVIDKNNASILIGFIAVPFVKPFQTSPKLIDPQVSKRIANNNGISQNSFGFTKLKATIPTQLNAKNTITSVTNYFNSFVS